jgi:hypothetical protein
VGTERMIWIYCIHWSDQIEKIAKEYAEGGNNVFFLFSILVKKCDIFPISTTRVLYIIIVIVGSIIPK